MDYDFNSSLYSSDGSSVAGPATTTVKSSDSSLLDKFLGVVGVGADAYSKVVAAQKSSGGNKSTATEPKKTTAPVIGVESAGMSGSTKALIIGGIAAVVLLFGFLLLRKK